MIKKIAVDLRTLDTPSGKRGIGYYTLNQFQALERISPIDLEFIFYTIWGGKKAKQIQLKKKDKFWPLPSIYRPARGLRKLDPLFAKFWHQAIKKSNPDLIHITSLFDIIYVDIPPDIRSVVTFYDLIPYFNLEKYFGNEKARNWYRQRLNQLNHTTKIIAISQSVKDDLIKHLNLPSSKIQVVYGGFDDRFKLLDKAYAQAEISKKYKIKDKFILSLPAFSAHKNVDGIFKSFAKFSKENQKINLVVICKLIPQEEAIWMRQLQSLGIKDRVFLTNFVPDSDMPLFYNSAQLLLFPSLYEGFGLPILEAMACGCPVITSNVASMPEAGGSAAKYVNPESIDQIAGALKEVLADEKLQSQMIKKGFAQIKKFSWEECARQTLKIYQQILAN